jgi:hypothetical protein
MSLRRSLPFLVLLLILAAPGARAQFDQATMKALLEEYSLQLFGENAQGFMSPLVIVSNVGANHGFFNSAAMPKDDRLNLRFSVQTVYAWVRDDQRSYTGAVPYDSRDTDSETLKAFKLLVLQPAVRDGKLNPHPVTATAFGGAGTFFRIPKEYLFFLPDSVKRYLPDSLQLTSGTSQRFVFAGVPQLAIGTYKNTDLLVRYIPPVTFDTAVGKFSFFGIAARHSVSNWFNAGEGYDGLPLDLAVQVAWQHSTIDNTVGDTRAQLASATDMYTLNVHASRRFDWIEPYAGLSVEHLRSSGSYTFTLPKNIVDQIGYDISPQKALIHLDDTAIKLTLGVTAHLGPVQAFASAGISKHFILGAGLSYGFDVLRGVDAP